MSRMRPFDICSAANYLISETRNRSMKFDEQLFYPHLYRIINWKYVVLLTVQITFHIEV